MPGRESTPRQQFEAERELSDKAYGAAALLHQVADGLEDAKQRHRKKKRDTSPELAARLPCRLPRTSVKS